MVIFLYSGEDGHFEDGGRDDEPDPNNNNT